MSLLVLRFLLTIICQTERYQINGYKHMAFANPLLQDARSPDDEAIILVASDTGTSLTS